MEFEPIAIVGQSCLLPGALNPKELTNLVFEGKDVITKVPDGYWRTDPKFVLTDSPKNVVDSTWSDRGGYVKGFESVFNPEGFALPADEILNYDIMVQWLLHTAREALDDANIKGSALKTGIIFGNLSYPSHSLTQYAESIWLDSQGDDFFNGKARELAGIKMPHPLNRYMSGMPAHIVANCLELEGCAFALDAACASSLYAIKLACDQLHDREADVMLAGGVNRADDLIIHIGFCVLQAMSHTGQSRPFHKNADGLVPAEGAGFVALKRLDDAVKNGDKIYGVIRAVGLSNDGRGHGLLVPFDKGQERAMQKAYEISGVSREDISLIECHATGTMVGDAVEIRSMSSVYKGMNGIPIGTIKSNMGHPITASGIAGILKVLGAFERGMRPKTLHVEEPLDEINGTPFRLLTENEPWDAAGPRKAAINNFGFGGNNAHLIVEEWIGQDFGGRVKKYKAVKKDDIAVVGIGVIAADAVGRDAFAGALFSGNSRLRGMGDGRFGGFTESIELPLMGLSFPPADLEQTLPQQLLLFKSAMEALSDVKSFPADRAVLFTGMQCDAEVSRGALGWKMKQLASCWTGKEDISGLEGWLNEAKSRVNPFSKAPAVLGAMPNIVANRVSNQFNILGQSFTVSSEELSGITALKLAMRALWTKEADAAIASAVDICCEEVNETAARETLPEPKHIPGDSAVTIVLKRLEDARRDNEQIYAVIPGAPPKRAAGSSSGSQLPFEEIFGHSHAASGLLNTAGSILSAFYGVRYAGKGQAAIPILNEDKTNAQTIMTDALGNRSDSVIVIPYTQTRKKPLLLCEMPQLYIYSGIDRKEILQNLKSGVEADTGPARLVIVSTPDKLQEMKEHARGVIEKGDFKDHINLSRGIFYRDNPVRGETAFVFTGSAGVYHGIGREIMMAFPDFSDEIKRRFGSLDPMPSYFYNTDKSRQPDPEDMLWSSTFLSQVHAEISQNVLNLRADAAIGFSSGESNSLFAMGAWNDIHNMVREFSEAGVFTHALGGKFEVVKKAWAEYGVKDVHWSNWNVRAPKDEIIKAISDDPLVHLIIINSPHEAVIGGQEEACLRVIDRLGTNLALRIPYTIANHCPEIKHYSDAWLRLHSRETKKVNGIRFYTSSTCGYYYPDKESAANALWGMGVHMLDFPKMIENAYNDGVRIFIEHGPRDSCTRWINDTLAGREFVAVPLDVGGKSSILQIIHAAAQLKAAGIHIDSEKLAMRGIIRERAPGQDDTSKSIKTVMKKYFVHPPKVILPPLEIKKDEEKKPETLIKEDVMKNPLAARLDPKPQFMPPAPLLPHEESDAEAVSEKYSSSHHYASGVSSGTNGAEEHYGGIATSADFGQTHSGMNTGSELLETVMNSSAATIRMHREFILRSVEAHNKFIDMHDRAISILMNVSSQEAAPPDLACMFGASAMQAHSSQSVASEPSPTMPEISAEGKLEPRQSDRAIQSAPFNEIAPDIKKQQSPAAVPPPRDAEKNGESPVIKISSDTALKKQFENPVELDPTGPTFSREQLKILASGKISEVFGPLFEQQDGYELQVRLPEDPLLLADRIIGIDAEPGVLGKGVMWTETDVVEGAWYLQDIYMPAGVTIEAGQCDLSLISYMGIDFLNKGNRVYRLLGCDLMYYGRPPKIGDTLRYQIHVDGHANVGDTRIFFFHYDCRIKNELILSVRNAQAGFFTYDQLKESGGVLWDAETGEHTPDSEARVDPPFVKCAHKRFSREKILAFSQGDAYECFGKGFEITASHTKTPKLPHGMMLLIQEVAEFDPAGGPWKRGYIRVENDIHPDDWYLPGHFKNDPCMPGTLMSDACMQVLGFYIAAMGYTIHRDGWRLDPVKNEAFQAKCRGQVSTDSKKLVYEAYIDEFIAEPYPTVFADLLATVDGLKCLHIKRLGIRLVPDFPLDCWPHLIEGHVEKKPVAINEGFEFGYRSLMACAFGKPSEAFGRLGKHFDDGRHIARLPGPPYHFMTRVTEINATMGAMISKGEKISVEYDIPRDAWYFEKNGFSTMPFCVLMEVALQPCGWLSVFEGGVAVSREPLLFRNLDGTAIQHVEIFPDTGTITTRTSLTNIAQLKGVALFNFDVECYVDDTLVYSMKTGFGFFLRTAFDQQFGIPMNEKEKLTAKAEIEKESDFYIDLTERPRKYCKNSLRLPEKMLLMLDRVTGYWPEGGEKGLGRLRAEKDVNIKEWFFKAHFFHDPVQPGSLGVEAIIQLLQFYMIHEDMGKGTNNPRFEPLWIGKPITWKYRGQVTPNNKMITTELNIQEIGEDEKGPYAIAEGSLWVDGLKIYHVKDIGVRIVSGGNKGGKISREKKSDNAGIPAASVRAKEPDMIINETAKQLAVDPSTITISEDKKFARCSTMPLNVFPITVKKKAKGAESVKTGQSQFDWDNLIKYGRELLGHSPCLFEDISRELCIRFVNNLIIEDPAAFDAVRKRNLLYIANHQVQIESMLFTGLAHYLNDALTVAVSDAIHIKGWLGRLNNIAYEYPVVKYQRNLMYFDQNARESMFDIITRFKNRITEEGISVLVHVEGKLGLTCRKPVTTLSSVFIDMAIDCDLPIVPIRFTRGLPVEEMKSPIDFPFRYCKQDYYIGNPIFPDMLKSMPYAERRKYVLNALNTLGLPSDKEEPYPPDIEFEKEINEYMKKKNLSDVQSVFYKTLEKSAYPLSAESQAMLDYAQKGNPFDSGDEIGLWLQKFAGWLFEK